MPEIRLLSLEDLPTLVNIELAANLYPWTEGVFRSCFNQQYFNYGVFQHEQLQGFYIGQFLGVESQLFNIAVAPQAQGQGFGKLLLAHFVAQSTERNALDAWLEVRATNQQALHLYQQAGFIETGRRNNYYVSAQGREDALLMCLPLAFS
ncbi:ribosomal protein S18-alanine N-acetyltransferase [Alishewanella sp. SMS8]|uniref:ribosomal protein S18-alanine N-acetyltransferase n=1 Tax=unclassified Alishewanella TaxID=2628974 RepID=UPI00274110E7|nr:ribosomal protein S18-alanine N-acetyltransferase [Alishewanella sp. SMS8]MDP4945098.1 ribosomal protein S18-alanine N-acetyltransferase [Alishewanella sp.]MDP5035057.1 ribosomal protein S18-alanine N-acetyltransferase [Alishewanella sp.]MDP5187465.1 ribosomal protein S18-alanine N-acetyltransferase [Alishewanella sp.]MDP5460880.1 ribosomal protein S18-alanine N-acetyltransferase [Alishewanella sp. SMS8]